MANRGVKYKRNQLKIDKFGNAQTISHFHPPQEENVIELPFREYFTDVNNSKNMAVNGAPSVEFAINASNDFDIYIKNIIIEIGDGGNPALNEFGALGELNNGVEWVWSTSDEPDYTPHEGITTNKDFIKIAIGTIGIGSGTDAFLADVSGGGTEKSYLPIIPLSDLFGMVHGLRLKKGSKDSIKLIVRDDLTGLLTFNAIGTGKRIR